MAPIYASVFIQLFWFILQVQVYVYLDDSLSCVKWRKGNDDLFTLSDASILFYLDFVFIRFFIIVVWKIWDCCNFATETIFDLWIWLWALCSYTCQHVIQRCIYSANHFIKQTVFFLFNSQRLFKSNKTFPYYITCMCLSSSFLYILLRRKDIAISFYNLFII